MISNTVFPQGWYAKNLIPFSDGDDKHLFVADGSRIYDVEETVAYVIDKMRMGLPLNAGEELLLDDLLGSLQITDSPYIKDEAPAVPQLNSISINVAQVCNMSCTYCYANEGKFM